MEGFIQANSYFLGISASSLLLLEPCHLLVGLLRNPHGREVSRLKDPNSQDPVD